VWTHKWSLFVLWLVGIPLSLLVLYWFFGVGPVTIMSNIGGR